MSSEILPRRLTAFVVLAALALPGCGAQLRRFPAAEPMWVDVEDRRAYAPPPDDYYSPFGWDGADQMLFRPMARFFAADASSEAINVNAMDEVPDSSWFENRVGRQLMPASRVVRASCEEQPLDPTRPWTITDAKPNGANPGFIIEGPDGRKFLLKYDSLMQPERATSADVIGSILYWAAGYHVPCNRIVYFDRDVLQIADDATADIGGEEVPLTFEMLAEAFDRAPRNADGQMRAVASRFLPGRPIGPWRYEGVRLDDPNDVVPHEHRRELRGAYVIASWINHFDSREQNTLSIWIEGEGETGHVQHDYIDWGDSFGSMWGIEGISRRLGHASYLDMRFLLVDFVTLGLIPRPWNEARLGPTGQNLGYFDTARFVADTWRPGYPNPAFNQSTEHDNAWMARILANFTDEHLVATLAAARMTDRLVHDELLRILRGRRDILLRRWLTELSPLTWPRVEATADGARLCMRDQAVASHIVDPAVRPYWARAWVHAGGDALEPMPVGPKARRGAADVCVGLPSVSSASAEAPAYLIVDVAGHFVDGDDSPPARVHLYQLGATEYRVVGLERPDDLEPPG